MNGTRFVHDRLEFIHTVAGVRDELDSAAVEGLTSNLALRALAPGLQALGYTVELSARRAERIRRPGLFGDRGEERVAYHVDAVHDDLGVLVEIEAGRGGRGNAVYRDLVRSSLIVGARFLVLGVMREYWHLTSGRQVTVRSYDEAKAVLDAIYASGRLGLRFEGVLLVGY